MLSFLCQGKDHASTSPVYLYVIYVGQILSISRADKLILSTGLLKIQLKELPSGQARGDLPLNEKSWSASRYCYEASILCLAGHHGHQQN